MSLKYKVQSPKSKVQRPKSRAGGVWIWGTLALVLFGAEGMCGETAEALFARGSESYQAGDYMGAARAFRGAARLQRFHIDFCVFEAVVVQRLLECPVKQGPKRRLAAVRVEYENRFLAA